MPSIGGHGDARIDRHDGCLDARQDHLKGRDVAEFLNRIHTNAWSKLAIGRCRYELMLGENGRARLCRRFRVGQDHGIDPPSRYRCHRYLF